MQCYLCYLRHSVGRYISSARWPHVAGGCHTWLVGATLNSVAVECPSTELTYPKRTCEGMFLIGLVQGFSVLLLLGTVYAHP